MSAENLATIAGSGVLPDLLAERYPDAMMIRLAEHGAGRTGDLLKSLKARGISRLCLIGGLKRPNWWTLWPSWESWKLIFKHGFSFKGGDDALLTRLRRLLEAEGFTLAGVHDLCPDLLAPEGLLGGVAAASPNMLDHYRPFIRQAQEIGRADKGQAVVVVEDKIIDAEDRSGTNALIARNAGWGAVLVKVAKPQQDIDLDMPAIGPDTLETAARSGFAGIVVEAGRTLVIEPARCAALAQEHGLFVLGVAP